ncbi:MAG: PAS domain S-box protein [Cyclobacteriaceae bacterium]|nr:PAS domain S-box protein [Cyclobacteriaceae bacterium]
MNIAEFTPQDTKELNQLFSKGHDQLIRPGRTKTSEKKLITDENEYSSQEEQINIAIKALLNIAKGDYKQRAPVNGEFDKVDSLGLAINILAEELEWKTNELIHRNNTLNERNHFISSITQTISDIIYVLDTSTLKVLYSNKEPEEFLGYSNVPITGKTIYKVIKFTHPEDFNKIKSHFSKIKHLKKDGVLKIEFRIKKADNTWIWLQQEITPFIFNETGDCIQALGKITDITELIEKENQVRMGEERYRTLSESSTDAIVISDARGIIISWNKGAENIFGYSEKQAIGAPIDIILPDKLLNNSYKTFMQKVIRHPAAMFGLTRELSAKRIDGEIFPVEVNLSRWGKNLGDKYYSAIIRDITERKNTERELQKLSMVARESRYAIIITDHHGNIEWVNHGFENATGYPLKEVIGDNLIHKMQRPDTDPEELLKIQNCMIEKKPVSGEILTSQKNGEILWFHYDIVPVFNLMGEFVNFVSTQTDITSRKTLEKKLIDSNHEKEVLLREIHHRVKNNLQIVNSLFDIQMSRIADPETKNVLLNSKSRIKSISLIHEQLYMFEHLSKIVFSNYLESLQKSIVLSLNNVGSHVETKMDMEPIELDVNTAIPLGLIANELITNAFKYSVKDNSESVILVRFKKVDKKCVFSVCDNGPGLPDNFLTRKENSLGYKIINSLVSQLDAQLTFVNEEGASVSIIFDHI